MKINEGGVYDPPFDQWPDIISTNGKRFSKTMPAIVGNGFGELRCSLISSSLKYTQELNKIAKDAGLSHPPTPFISDSNSQSERPAGAIEIAMSGHQPTVFHSGIVEKLNRLSAMVNQQDREVPSRIAIFVLIDTDEADGGDFLVPDYGTDQYSIEKHSISTGNAPFMFQQLIDSKAMKTVFDQARESISNADLANQVSAIADVADRYQSLGCIDIVAANSIIRRSFGIGTDCLEIPMSIVCGLPQVGSFFERIIRDGERFHTIYNQTLSTFRAENKIRNDANPFPDLATDNERVELPFWIIDRRTMSRKPLILDPTQGEATLKILEQENDDLLLAPRGMMITVLLRLLASDLFIHGTGGAKYDLCTDSLIRNYFGCEPPQFVVATATRHLLHEQLSKAESQNRFPQLFRQMCSHTERFLDDGSFSPETNRVLRPLVDQRTILVLSLTDAKTKQQPAGEFGRGIGEIDKRVKQILTSEFRVQLDESNSNSKSHLKILRTREFPFFLFADETPCSVLKS